MKKAVTRTKNGVEGRRTFCLTKFISTHAIAGHELTLAARMEIRSISPNDCVWLDARHEDVRVA
jgi:hypothetical protein